MARSLQGKILEEIWAERGRQETLKREGRFKYSCADAEMTEFEKLAILTRELGEVAQATGKLTAARHNVNLRTELIQVAAVAMAWVESIDLAQIPHSDPAPVADSSK